MDHLEPFGCDVFWDGLWLRTLRAVRLTSSNRVPNKFWPAFVSQSIYRRRMGDSRLQAWLDANVAVFDRLNEAVTALASSAGECGRTAEAEGEYSEATSLALAGVRDTASSLLAELRDARAIEPIPDPDTARHFSAGLGRWTDAAETIEVAAIGRNAAEVERGGVALQAGGDEVFRAAAALRRATGQSPDPSNPFD